MDDRHESDYELISAISKQDAQLDITQAIEFVEKIEIFLKKNGWL